MFEIFIRNDGIRNERCRQDAGKALEILKKIGYTSITHLVREGMDNKAINHVHFHTIPNIRIGDLDHYGQERKMLSNLDIENTIEDMNKFL